MWRAVMNMVLLIQQLCRSLRREPACSRSAGRSCGASAAHKHGNTTFKEESGKVKAQACRIAM